MIAKSVNCRDTRVLFNNYSHIEVSMHLRNKLILLALICAAAIPAWADSECPDSTTIKNQMISNADPNPHGLNNWDATTEDFGMNSEDARWNVAVQNFKMTEGSSPIMAMNEAQKILKNSQLIEKPKLISRPDDPSQFMCIYYKEGGLGDALLIAAYQYKSSDRS